MPTYADPDFVPAKIGKSIDLAIDDREDEDIDIFPAIATDIPLVQEHHNCKTKVNVSHTPANRKSMTHAERTCEKDEKKRLKIERNYFIKKKQDASTTVSGQSNAPTLLQDKQELHYINIWGVQVIPDKSLLFLRE